MMTISNDTVVTVTAVALVTLVTRMMMTHLHGADHLDLGHIPQLRLTVVGADRQVGPSLTPGNRAHAVLRLAAAEVTQLGDFAGACRPQVHTCAQTHCQNILGGPVYQVEVEVVL